LSRFNLSVVARSFLGAKAPRWIEFSNNLNQASAGFEPAGKSFAPDLDAFAMGVHPMR